MNTRYIRQIRATPRATRLAISRATTQAASRGALALAAATLALASAVPASAQTPRPIQPGQPARAQFAGDSLHRYSIDLGEGMFVYGEVRQAVDVVVTVKDPTGATLGVFDGPGRGAAEPFQFETDSAGEYAIELAPFEDGRGGYGIRILTVEPVATDPEARVGQLIRMYDGDRPGGVIGVVEDGRLAFVRAYGMANVVHGVPWEAGTVSNIGSVTKQFTAMALLLLEADGLLHLDDDVREHIPELPDFGTPVTLRQFLNHTSGYREIYNLLPLAGFRGEDSFEREKAIQVVQRQPTLQTPPNTEWNYNNTGYILLSLIVERVSGQSFADFMRERVFEPLGMRDTRVKMVQGEVIPGSAQGYVPVKTGMGYRTARDLPASAGAGGIYTTVDDLARWMLNYRDAALGGPDAVRAIATPAVLENGDTTTYGLGLGIGELSGRVVYAHTGGDVAHRAYLGYFPELEAGVVVMSNNASFDLGLGVRIARVFLAEELEAAEDEDEGAGEGEAADEEAAEEEDGGEGGMSPERVAAIAGAWVISAPGTKLDADITVEDGRIFFQAVAQPRLEVSVTSDSTISIAVAQAAFTFHFEADGSAVAATLHQGGLDMPMRRSEKEDLTEAALAEFAGRYFSEELETFYEIEAKDGGLALLHIDMEPVELRHREGDEFTTAVIFMASVEFERDDEGRITGFRVSNGRTRGVWFGKT